MSTADWLSYPAVRELYPDGVDAALDLVGIPTLPDTLRAVRVHGTACFSSLGKAKWSLRCAHALSTYLHVLSPATVPLNPACT